MEKQLKTIKHVYSTVYHGEQRCMQNANFLSVNNAIVYPNDKLLYKKSDNTIDFIDLSTINKSVFFDKGSNQDTVYGNVVQKYSLAKSHLSFNPDEYECEMIDTGETFILNLIDKNLPTIIAVSEIYPTYFDLGLCSQRSNPVCLDFRHRILDNLKHSGDINIVGSAGSTLLHCISGQFNPGMKYVTVISGFQSTPLYRYLERRPIVTIIDHEKKIIYVIPVPLDEFTIGQSTICLPIGITCLESSENSKQRLLIEIFSNTKSCDSYIPDLSSTARDTVAQSIEMISSDIPIEKVVNETVKVNISHEIEVDQDEEYKIPSMGEHSVLIYSGVDEIGDLTKKINPDILIRSMNTHIIYRKQNDKYELHPEYHDMNSKEELNIGQQHFPNLLPMEGGSILFASKTVPRLNSNQSVVDQIHQTIFRNTFPVFIIGPMDDLCRQAATKLKFNAIYIRIVDYPGEEIMIDDVKRNTFLENACMNGVTAYAGPLSLVFIAIQNPTTKNFQYFYVDGIRHENFIDTIPLFGADVTSLIESKLTEREPMQNSIVDLTDEKVLFKKDFIPFSDFRVQLLVMSLDEMVANKADILDVISQCQRIYGHEMMRKCSDELLLLLESKINEVISECKKSFCLDLQSDKQKLANEVGRVTGMIRKIKQSVQDLVDKIGLAISKRRQSSIRFNLAQLKKKETIKQNVQRALHMSYQDFSDLLDELCNKSGVLWLNLDSQYLLLMLKAIKENEMHKYMTEPILPLIRCRNGDFNIDSFTISILLEQTAHNRFDPIRPQQVDGIVTSLPVSATPEGLQTSSWFFPLFDRYKDLQVPYDVNWINEANHPDIASFRILARNTISNASILRDLQLNIQPQDVNITRFLIYITLSAMDELIKQRSNSSESIDFNDTFSVNIRCLLCSLLTYTASGNVPASFAWQLFTRCSRPDIPKERFEWGIYARTVEYVQYTGWNLEKLKFNVRALLCRMLNQVVLRVTKPFRESEIKEKKSKFGEEYIRRLHTIYYPHYEKLVRYCIHIRETNEPIDQEKVDEIFRVLGVFDNRRYRVGSIYQLRRSLKHKFQNRKFDDQLINCILYKWDNYDRRYKLELDEFTKNVFFSSSSTEQFNANSVLAVVNDFRSRLITERPKVLSMIQKETQPITNHDEIQTLLTLIESSIPNKDQLSDDDLNKLSACLDDIHKNENKLWQPFNPFPQFIQENNIEKLFTENDQQETVQVEDNQDIVLYRDMFKEHYCGVLEQIAYDSCHLRLDGLLQQTPLNSIDEFITLAKFAGFGQTYDEIARMTKTIIHSLLINCKKSADEGERLALVELF
ncbi:unnamed protein product [Adineta ricciae]|uniref:Uncharacterized protein n=1 Tax=Adineta ricciae TaxID=249248 RepID=A0A815RJF6_ADIRI|nr:unnamed protein product [Adineta ricciae]CAF1478239.1 unnamed protein product [Adineta ricciae]